MSAADLDRDRIHARLLVINAQVADLNAEAEGLKADLRTLGPGTFAANGSTFTITPPRAFDVQAAIALVPAEKRPLCLAEPTLDPAKVKRHLTPDQLEACMKVTNGKAKVTLS